MRTCQIRGVSLFSRSTHRSVDQVPTFLSCANASGSLVSRPAASNRMYTNLFLLGCVNSPRHAGVASAEVAASSFASTVGSATSLEATF